MNIENRKTLLLKIAYKFLKKQENSTYVLNLLEQTEIWDEVECDGYCLMEEIKHLLEVIEITQETNNES